MSENLGPYLIGPNASVENGIFCGDARELMKAVPDESVSLILTDPVYNQIEDYRWLAEAAARVLVDGGSLIAQVGRLYLSDALRAMDGPLTYWWTIAQYLHSTHAVLHGRKVVISWKPHVWYVKGKQRLGEHVFDWIKGGGRMKRRHSWEDNPAMFSNLVGRLAAGGIVLDPFTGSGSVPVACKRMQTRYVAFDADREAVVAARDRVRQTQAPFPSIEVKQLVLDWDAVNE